MSQDPCEGEREDVKESFHDKAVGDRGEVRLIQTEKKLGGYRKQLSDGRIP
jgi:hypothetical protein